MMQQQMSLFQEGGLEQDGGTVDPVSGNEVPVGSSQEEVRDDIPAQLSEGEFVFPADVVRFLGLEFLMNLRQRAKAGLKKMEEMGQMGNSEEATIPDDVPFTIDDLDMEDDPQEMAQGGVMAANGVFTQPSKFQRTPATQTGTQPIVQQPDEQATFYDAPAQTTEQQPVASFEDLFGGDVSYGYDELRKYVGPNGEIEYIAFKDGQPLPAYAQKLKDLTDKGFTYEDPTKVEEEDPRDVMVDTAQVTQKDKEGDSTSFENMRERENQIQENYRNAIERVMDSEKMSAEEAVQFIKDGNYTVMGKKVPGFLFPNISLANQNLNNPSPYAIIDPDNFDKSGNQIAFTNFSLEDAAKIAAGGFEDPEEGYPTGTTFTSTFKPAEAAEPNKILGGSQAEFNKMTGGGGRPIPVTDKSMFANIPENQVVRNFNEGPPSLSDRPIDLTKRNVVTTNIQDPSDIKPFTKAAIEDKEKRRRDVETARLQAIADARKDEREANQAKARQETAREKMQKQTPYKSGGRFGGFKEGGIASKKPKKKKVMKRGGLASKK